MLRKFTIYMFSTRQFLWNYRLQDRRHFDWLMFQAAHDHALVGTTDSRNSSVIKSPGVWRSRQFHITVVCCGRLAICIDTLYFILYHNYYHDDSIDTLPTGAKRCKFQWLIFNDLGKKTIFNSLTINHLFTIICISYENLFTISLSELISISPLETWIIRVTGSISHYKTDSIGLKVGQY